MSTRNPHCPKCDGQMEEGFLIDANQNMATVTHWADGAPSFYFLKILRMKGRRKLPVRSLRCRKCGLLESYAVETS
jgi:hypothetical protein